MAIPSGILTPHTLPEALDALATDRADVIPIAGGTNVVVGLREGMHGGKTLLSVGRLSELRGIRQEEGWIIVGGGITLAEVLESRLLAAHGHPLYQAALVFANPLVRNRATVAGNLVDASPAADTAPALLVLDAQVDLVSAKGSRRIPLDQFMVGPNQTLRREDELVLSVRWPIPSGTVVGAFHKLALRRGTACSVLSVAVLIEYNDSRQTSRARIALGAAAPRPIRVHRAEEVLLGQPLSPERIADAARLASEAAQPIDDVRSTGNYRRRMAAVLTHRLLSQAMAALG
jgi:CO/xanthine dehydrogenase FAD-binding subunit